MIGVKITKLNNGRCKNNIITIDVKIINKDRCKNN